MIVKSARTRSHISADGDVVPFDDQQARLLSILSRRAGQLVTYDELRAAGIELPASLVAEIELAGVELDRFQGVGDDGRAVMGVRLPSPAKHDAGPADTGGDAAAIASRTALPRHRSPPQAPPNAAAAATGWGAVRVYRGSLRRALARGWAELAGRKGGAGLAVGALRDRPRPHLAVLVALVMVAAGSIAVAVAAISSGDVAPQSATPHKTRQTGSVNARGARLHGRTARAPSNAHAARTTATSQTVQGLNSGASQQPAPASPTTDRAPTADSSSPPAPSTTAESGYATSGQSLPQAAVQAFYEAAARHRYAAAWALADANMRDEVGGHTAFESQMSSVRAISFQAVHVLQQAPTWATISVRTTSVQTDRTHECWGTVRTVEQSGAWLLDGISIHCS